MPNPFEEVAAKGAGKAKAMSARLQGLTGVFARLAEQHGEVSVLLSRLRANEDPEKRDDLWAKIRTELISHERAELTEVYATLGRYTETKRIADEHAGEAGALESVITDLDNIDFTSSLWDEKIEQLISLVKHHVEEEEHEYFPKAQDVLGKDVAMDLERRFLTAQESVKSQIA